MLYKHVRARAPLRIGLAGGGSDIKSFSDIYSGAVLNMTICKYAFCEIKQIDKGFFAIANDINQKLEIDLENPEIISKKDFGKLFLHWNTYQFIMQEYNNKDYLPVLIKTYCDSPVGSGLGSSSALVVSMLKAWSELLNLGLDDYKVAQHAIYIERNISLLEGGQQDQYSASFGGINFIEFKKDNTIVHPLKIQTWFKYELESSLLLHYTGVSRISSEIIKDQILFMNNNCKENQEILKLVKDNAYKMRDALLKKSTKDIIQIINNARKLKSLTSSKIESSFITERIKFGMDHGAKAAKVSGAGGGGFILFITEPENSISLRNKLIEFNQQTFLVNLCEDSAHSWVI
ncbi:hypothetical protein OAX47_02175 [Prochlorococcus sp. AH-736-K09]|nr:hypothetical protein [Prochlorococcus sp. AH-736-K09]